MACQHTCQLVANVEITEANNDERDDELQNGRGEAESASRFLVRPELVAEEGLIVVDDDVHEDAVG